MIRRKRVTDAKKKRGGVNSKSSRNLFVELRDCRHVLNTHFCPLCFMAQRTLQEQFVLEEEQRRVSMVDSNRRRAAVRIQLLFQWAFASSPLQFPHPPPSANAPQPTTGSAIAAAAALAAETAAATSVPAAEIVMSASALQSLRVLQRIIRRRQALLVQRRTELLRQFRAAQSALLSNPTNKEAYRSVESLRIALLSIAEELGEQLSTAIPTGSSGAQGNQEGMKCLRPPPPLPVEFSLCALFDLLKRIRRIGEVGHWAAIRIQATVRRFLVSRFVRKELLTRFEFVPATTTKNGFFNDTQKLRKWARYPHLIKSEVPGTPRTIMRRLKRDDEKYIVAKRRFEEDCRRILRSYNDLFPSSSASTTNTTTVDNSGADSDDDISTNQSVPKQLLEAYPQLADEIVDWFAGGRSSHFAALAALDLATDVTNEQLSMLRQIALLHDACLVAVRRMENRLLPSKLEFLRTFVPANTTSTSTFQFGSIPVWLSATAPMLPAHQLGIRLAMERIPPNAQIPGILQSLNSNLSLTSRSNAKSSPGSSPRVSARRNNAGSASSSFNSVGPSNSIASAAAVVTEGFNANAGGIDATVLVQINLRKLETEAWIALRCNTVDDILQALLHPEYGAAFKRVNYLARDEHNIWNAEVSLPLPQVMTVDEVNNVEISNDQSSATEESEEENSMKIPFGVMPFSIRVYPFIHRNPNGMFRLFFFRGELAAVTALSPWTYYPELYKNRDPIFTALRRFVASPEIRSMVRSEYARTAELCSEETNSVTSEVTGNLSLRVPSAEEVFVHPVVAPLREHLTSDTITAEQLTVLGEKFAFIGQHPRFPETLRRAKKRVKKVAVAAPIEAPPEDAYAHVDPTLIAAAAEEARKKEKAEAIALAKAQAVAPIHDIVEAALYGNEMDGYRVYELLFDPGLGGSAYGNEYGTPNETISKRYLNDFMRCSTGIPASISPRICASKEMRSSVAPPELFVLDVYAALPRTVTNRPTAGHGPRGLLRGIDIGEDNGTLDQTPTINSSSISVEVHEVIGMYSCEKARAPLRLQCGLFSFSYFHHLSNAASSGSRLRSSTSHGLSAGVMSWFNPESDSGLARGILPLSSEREIEFRLLGAAPSIQYLHTNLPPDVRRWVGLPDILPSAVKSV